MRKNWVEGVVFEMTLDPFEMTLTGDTSVKWTYGGRSPHKGVWLKTGQTEGALYFGRKSEANLGLFRVTQEYQVSEDCDHIDFGLSATYMRTGVIPGLSLRVGSRIECEAFFFDRNALFQFKIAVTVVGNPRSFGVSPWSYTFVLVKEKQERGEGIIEIRNPNLLQFEARASSDKITLSPIENQGGEVVRIPIHTKSSQELDVGSFREQIVIKSSQGSERVIPVYISVKKELEMVERDIYFCKDKDLLEVRAKGDGDYMEMQLKIHFSGYGQEKEVTQRYEYVFFQGKVKIDIGEEVQDFFEGIPNLHSLTLNETRDITVYPLYKAAVVDVVLVERALRGEEKARYELKGLRYLPGKKPKGYPYLTESLLRSTYPDSMVSLSGLLKDIREQQLVKIVSDRVRLTEVREDYEVGNFSFLRSVADIRYSPTSIITYKGLSLEPKPKSNDRPILGIFENQNQCPDWFSFAGEWEGHVEYQHQIGEHLLSRERYKERVEEKRTFKLNTGWIFAEEIAVLWELVRSEQCFLKIQGEWVKVIPISQKPLSYDSTRNLHSYVVEFQESAIRE
jgi:hypothetical protein